MKKQIHFITQGCSANHSDTEVMQGLLQEQGYTFSPDADLVVINTCTVKGPTETSFKRNLEALKAEGKEVIIAGCIAQSEPTRPELNGHALIGTYNLSKITDVVDSLQKSSTKLKVLDRNNAPRLNLPKFRKDQLVEIVPISHGCLSSCTFCKTKHARGQLYSYSIDDLLRHIRSALTAGVKELWLTSQDCSAYGFDIGTNLAELLQEICSIPKDFRVRIGMGNPDHFLKILDEFIKVISDERIYKFVHIPVQAGSNKVLSSMKRDYTVEEYEFIVSSLRASYPLINLTTDIICGYPTETEADFEQTLALMRRCPADNVNISRFWPRPGTPAAKLKPLPGPELKRRTRLVTKYYREEALKLNKRWLGKTQQVCVMEDGKANSFLARNSHYKQVVLRDRSVAKGQSFTVNIDDCTAVDLRAAIGDHMAV